MHTIDTARDVDSNGGGGRNGEGGQRRGSIGGVDSNGIGGE